MYWSIGIILLALGMGFATGHQFSQSVCDSIVLSIRDQHMHELSESIESARKETMRRVDEVVKLERENEKKSSIINGLNRKLADIRLYDHASTCLPGDSDSGKPQKETPGTELSEEFTRFLRAETLRADEAALYAQTCHDWIRGMSEYGQD